MTCLLRPNKRFLARAPVVLACALLLAACSWLAPAPTLRGNKISADQLKQLVPGTSTRADVTAVVGSPTARATFDDNTWIYITELTQPRIGRVLGVLEQGVVVMSFNDQGVLQDIKQLNQNNALPVTMVARTTPSPGTEANFFQQLFGNIGRFNAGGASTTPGSAAGGASSAGGAPAPY